jgi:hypothetical protein
MIENYKNGEVKGNRSKKEDKQPPGVYILRKTKELTAAAFNRTATTKIK